MPDPLIEVSLKDGEVEVAPRNPEVRSTTDMVEIIPVQNMLGINLPSSQEVTQMKDIIAYLTPQSNGTGDLLYQLRQLENRLSTPKLGESRLAKLHNYIKMTTQIKDLETQRDSLLT